MKYTFIISIITKITYSYNWLLGDFFSYPPGSMGSWKLCSQSIIWPTVW